MTEDINYTFGHQSKLHPVIYGLDPEFPLQSDSLFLQYHCVFLINQQQPSTDASHRIYAPNKFACLNMKALLLKRLSFISSGYLLLDGHGGDNPKLEVALICCFSVRKTVQIFSFNLAFWTGSVMKLSSLLGFNYFIFCLPLDY